MKLRVLLFLALVPLVSLRAATYYANASSGSDANAGTSANSSWKTLNRAASQVGPGDTVIISPGVYAETVQLWKNGVVGKPITFRADAIAERRVTISGAVPNLRKLNGAWQLEDSGLALYSARLEFLPARVLYDQVDLFGYGSLDALKKFTVGEKTPGPRHGFAFDAASQKLYVRLHEAGRYGDRDPRKHVMKISPASGTGGALRQISQPSHYNFGILSSGANNVVLQGLTFETPGVAGVFVRGGNVTVRDCWFLGCRTGVAGNSDGFDESQRTSNVTVEYCSFSQFPTFDDVVEVVDRARTLDDLPGFYWWQRKGGDRTYELGLVCKAGTGWIIRGNRIQDALDGLSSWSIGTSKNLLVSNNRFERLVDNAVETENNAANMTVTGNWMIDVFEPVSWQPLGNPPWPGPISVYRNIVTSTAKGRALWPKLTWTAGAVKIKPNNGSSTPPVVPGAGFLFYNNTVVFPSGYAFTLSTQPPSPPKNFHFVNNVFVAEAFSNVSQPAISGMSFSGNFVAPWTAGKAGPGKTFAGTSGRTFPNLDAMQLADPENLNFAPRPASPVIGGGVSRTDLPDSTRDAGAIKSSGNGTAPPTGPRLTF